MKNPSKKIDLITIKKVREYEQDNSIIFTRVKQGKFIKKIGRIYHCYF